MDETKIVTILANQGQLAIQFKKQEAERKLMKNRAEKQRVKDKKNEVLDNCNLEYILSKTT